MEILYTMQNAFERVAERRHFNVIKWPTNYTHLLYSIELCWKLRYSMEHGVKKCQRETNVMKFKTSVLKDGGSRWLDKFTACILKTEGAHYFRSPSILKTEAAGDSRKVTSYTLKMEAASDSSSFLLLWRRMQQVPLLILVPTHSTTQHHIADDHSLDTTGRCMWCLWKSNTIKNIQTKI
jgi:hypothetical protein